MCMYLTMWLQTIIRCFAISACWMLVCICTHTMPCEVWSNNNQMIQSSFYLVSCIAVVINSWHEVVHFSLKWNVRNNICSVMCDEWYSVICNWQWVISRSTFIDPSIKLVQNSKTRSVWMQAGGADCNILACECSYKICLSI